MEVSYPMHSVVGMMLLPKGRWNGFARGYHGMAFSLQECGSPVRSKKKRRSLIKHLKRKLYCSLTLLAIQFHPLAYSPPLNDDDSWNPGDLFLSDTRESITWLYTRNCV